MKNSVVTLLLILLGVFAFLAFIFYYDSNGSSWLQYVQIPAIVFGVVIFILVNIPRIQKYIKKSESINASQKNVLFLTEDETILLDAGYRLVVRSTLFIPILCLFSKVLITNKRVQFGLYPIISFHTMSLFFKEQSSTGNILTSHLSSYRILRYKIGKRSVKFETINNESFRILMNREQLNSLRVILNNNIPAQDASI